MEKQEVEDKRRRTRTKRRMGTRRRGWRRKRPRTKVGGRG